VARLSTCKGCERKLKPEEKHIHNSKTYCNECYKKILRESTEYKQLIDFICTNYKIDKPTGFILKQIKELKEKFNYTYGGMTYTLWYCKEIKRKELLVKYGVSLIQYYYDEAANYYIQQEESKKQMEKLKDVKLKTKIVKINNQQEKNKIPLLDLNDLLGGVNH